MDSKILNKFNKMLFLNIIPKCIDASIICIYFAQPDDEQFENIQPIYRQMKRNI